jgi:hypothetical protein
LYIDSLTYVFGWSAFLCRIRFCDTLVVIFFQLTSSSLGDLNGVKFVVQKMWEFGVYARTSTMNLLLKKYAENGDGESAYALVVGVMDRNEETAPNR